MLPWCFQLVAARKGTHNISCFHFQPKPDNEQPPPPPSPPPRPPPVRTIKLIKSDGLVKVYHKPIHVSQLMLEFPSHMVCRSDSLYIGQKIPALSEHDHLQLGHNYFLLPSHFFQSVLSFLTIASFSQHRRQSLSHQQHQQQQKPASDESKTKIGFLKKAAGCCQPLEIQKTPSGGLRIRVSEEFISRLMEEGRIEEEEEEEEEERRGGVCTTAQLQRDYSQLVGSRQWKPKLETIREIDHEKMRKLSSFGMKRRMKKSLSMGNLKTSSEIGKPPPSFHRPASQ